MFESSVNSYDSQTSFGSLVCGDMFESSVNSYDSQTILQKKKSDADTRDDKKRIQRM